MVSSFISHMPHMGAREAWKLEPPMGTDKQANKQERPGQRTGRGETHLSPLHKGTQQGPNLPSMLCWDNPTLTP